jgi:hypothetical protein
MGAIPIEIICATRYSQQDFWARSALGNSLRRLAQDGRLLTRIIAANTRGLSEVYNESLAVGDPGNIAVMVHDDVWIDDYFLGLRLDEGLRAYDVVGVAGNRRRVPRQPAWACTDTRLQLDDATQLSGAVAHGKMPFGSIRVFGVTPAECELLDGVLLAARKSVLAERGVRFDPRFDFHFYDLDFCRTARGRGLRLGTWPICLTHQSNGGYGTESWKRGYQRYLEKWGD